MNRKTKEKCKVCRLIRMYVLCAIPLLIVIYLRPEFSLFKGILLTNLFATFISILFVVTVGWKAYIEFWKPYREKRKRKNA
ncbi:MAG: hypothetical protein VX086_03800 [Pseudomonadota bacterium]|nr:hypothetical protein [Pseudomonadota bacterium]